MSNEQFWKTGRWRMLFHASTLLRQAGKTIDPVSLLNFIKTAPRSMEELKEPPPDKSPFFECLKIADRNLGRDDANQASISQSFEFWLKEISCLSQREQSLLFFELLGQLEQAVSNGTIHEELRQFINPDTQSVT